MRSFRTQVLMAVALGFGICLLARVYSCPPVLTGATGCSLQGPAGGSPCSTCAPHQTTAQGANASGEAACKNENQPVCPNSCQSVGIPNGIVFVPNTSQSMAGLPAMYGSTLSSYAVQSDNDAVMTVYFADFKIVFQDFSGTWKQVKVPDAGAPASARKAPGDYVLSFDAGQAGESDDTYIVEERASGLPRKYYFKSFKTTPTAEDGKLWQIEEGGVTTTISLDSGTGRVSSVVDGYGRTTTYEYNGNDYVEYMKQSSASLLSDDYGWARKLIYDGGRIMEVWEGTPNVAQPSEDGHYDWRKTIFKYDETSDQLKYVVEPAYSSGLTEENIASRASVAYLYDGDTLTQKIGSNCSACAVGTNAGEKYYYPSPESFCPGAALEGRNAVTSQTTIARITQTTLGDNPAWGLHEKKLMNADNQVVLDYRVVKWNGGSDDVVLIEKHLYASPGEEDPEASAGREQKVYYYACTADHGTTSPYATSDLGNVTLKRVVQYVYDDHGFVQYVNVSADDTNWTTKKQYVRQEVNDVPTGRVLTEYDYKDNDTSYATDYTYDSSGRITVIQKPTVTVNWDKAGGADYRPETAYAYNSSGDLETVTDPTAVVTKYLYAYNDGIDQDGDGDADGEDPEGNEGFMLTKVIVGYGDASHLNLTTVYGYTKQNGKWMQTSTTDPNGHVTAYEVDKWGRRTKETTPEGYITETTYDDNDRVTQVVRKDNSEAHVVLAKSTTTYDVFGNVTLATEDPDDKDLSTMYRYDNGGRLREVRTRVYDAGFGENGPTGTVYGNVVQYDYEHTGTRTTYVKQGSRAATAVKVAYYEYDALGNKTKERRYRASDNDYNDVDYGYDPQGRRLTSVDGPGDAYTAYTYNDERDLVTQTEYRNDTANGAVLAQERTYYDEAARVYKTEVVNPGHTAFVRETNLYLDKAGRLCRVADAGSHNTDYYYDTAGRQYKVEDAAGNLALYTLDRSGNVTLVTAKHKLNATPTWRTERAFTWYDDDNRATTAASFGTNAPTLNWNPPTEPPKYDYEEWPSEPNASIATILATKYAYGYSAGEGAEYAQVTDAAGTITRSYNDKLGRTTQVVEDTAGIGRTTYYAYDHYDAQADAYHDEIEAANGGEANQITKYLRDDDVDASRVTKVTYPDSANDAVTYSFRRDGTPNTKLDQRGWTTTYAVNASGRVDNEVVSGTGVTGTKNVRYTYDALGRVTQVEDDNGQTDGGNPDYDYSKVTYSYAWDDDSADVTVTETHYLAGSQVGAVTGIYNSEGERTRLTYPNSRYVTYASDALHRLDTVTDDDSTVLTDYDYKGGYLQDRKLNADVLRLTFKNSSDLDGIDAFGRIGWMRQYDVSGPTDVVKLGYGRNYAGAPNYQEDLVTTSLSELYTYDTLHRLTNFKRGTLNGNKDGITGTVAREQSWTLQHVGNWADVTSTVNGGTADTPYDGREHDTVNQITHITPQGGSRFAVTSDSAGNLSLLPDRTDLTKADRYTYDFRNRLIKAEHSADYDQQAPTWTTTVDYLVDGLNRRVKKDLPGAGVDVIFVYDGWRCIEERELDGETWEARRQYVFGGLYLDEVLLFDKDTDADGDCTDAGGSSRYLYTTNDNYNVVAVTDGSGTLVERIQYDPYGSPTVTVEQGQTASGNPFLFQGQRYCPETGLYYFKNRDQSPTLGRFVQWDPLGYLDGMNLLLSARSNPCLYMDSLGLLAIAIQGPEYAVVMAAAGDSAAQILEVFGATMTEQEALRILAAVAIGKAVEQFVKNFQENAKGDGPCETAKHALRQAEKQVKSLRKVIEEHQRKIANPGPNMTSGDPANQNHVARAVGVWNDHIARAEFNIKATEMAISILGKAVDAACSCWYKPWTWF